MPKEILSESHADLQSVHLKCRIRIDGNNDPTILDITTDIRALPGVVTVKQKMPVSEEVSVSGKRAISIKVTYIEKFIDNDDKLMGLLKSVKTVDGLDMIKVQEHDNLMINNKLKQKPIVV